LAITADPFFFSLPAPRFIGARGSWRFSRLARGNFPFNRL
jgi:hypothetical protein